MEIFNPLKNFLSTTEKIKRWQKAGELKLEIEKLYKENSVLTKAQKEAIRKIREEYAEKTRELMIKYLKLEVDCLKNQKLKLQK